MLQCGHHRRVTKPADRVIPTPHALFFETLAPLAKQNSWSLCEFSAPSAHCSRQVELEEDEGGSNTTNSETGRSSVAIEETSQRTAGAVAHRSQGSVELTLKFVDELQGRQL